MRTKHLTKSLSTPFHIIYYTNYIHIFEICTIQYVFKKYFEIEMIFCYLFPHFGLPFLCMVNSDIV